MSKTKMTDKERRIEGKPTKDLFINMLVRDISLIDAIVDLVDNSIDGATRLRGNGDFNGLKIHITLNENCFSIEDNCGGIPIDLARNYAFRFGRPENAPETSYSVGQFGIGMKRALFKMGNKFDIESTAKKSKFITVIDVAKWRASEDWKFEFKDAIEKSAKETPFSDRIIGTKIRVTLLNEDVGDRFSQGTFASELIEKVELQHFMSIMKGIKIVINDKSLATNQLKLLHSNKIKTAFWKKDFKTPDKIQVRMYAGISEKDGKYGGWYIFCNNRLIIGPDQTDITVWGVNTPIRVPKYHSQFYRFRGYVFFSAKNPAMLPWNTAKNNIDIDSPKYQYIRQEMLKITRPVIDFLNEIHKEDRDYLHEIIEDKVLDNEVELANSVYYENAKTASVFQGPKAAIATRGDSKEVRISYFRSKNKIQLLEKFFNVKSRKKVGEKTFEYTYERECKK